MTEQPPAHWPTHINCKICTVRVQNPLIDQWESGARSGFIVMTTCQPCRDEIMGKTKKRTVQWIKRRNEGTLIAGPGVGVNTTASYDSPEDEVRQIMEQIDADLDAEYGPREELPPMVPRKRLVLSDYRD